MAALAVIAAAPAGVSCSSGDDPTVGSTAPPAERTIEVDGSGTVLPLNKLVAERFVDEVSDVRVSLINSGTGKGLQRSVEGGVNIVGASRAIEEAEALLAADNGAEYVELKVAIGGTAIVAHRDNRVIHCLTVEEMKRI